MTRRRRLEQEREQATRRIDQALADIREAAPEVATAVARLLAEIEGDTRGGR